MTKNLVEHEIEVYTDKLSKLSVIAQQVANCESEEDLSLVLHFTALDYIKLKEKRDAIKVPEVEENENLPQFLLRSITFHQEEKDLKEKALEESKLSFIENFTMTECLEFIAAYSTVINNKLIRLKAELEKY